MSRIESTGSYLPKSIINNQYFIDGSVMFESIGEYFTGFQERRHASKEESGVFMAARAAEKALAKSQYQAKDIDLIIGIILPSSHIYGDDLNLIQNEIGAWSASVLPINSGCSSFLSSLNIADSLIKSGKKKKILLVVSANWVNNMLDTKEPNFAFAGDGAAAVILDDEYDSFIDMNEINNTTPGIFNSMVLKNPLFTGKKEFFDITAPDGVSVMKDLILFPISVAKELLNRNPEICVDKLLLHQSGIKMMHIWANKLKLSISKIRHTLDLYANMTTANIPISLDFWIGRKDIKRGDTILFFSPSAGGHYIAILWRY